MVAFNTLISHRFRGFSRFENSIEGLRSALDFGVQIIEFDIRLARCGTPMIYHDEKSQDKNGNSHFLCEVMAKDYSKLGANFSHMPTAISLFEEIVAHENQTCKLLVDIKDAGIEDMLFALAKSFNLLNRIVWVSWLPEVIYAMNDIQKGQQLCLSHWCRRPGRNTRALHHIFSAVNGHIKRPKRALVVGERSGWFVDGPVRGELRQILTHVCVPAGQVWPELVAQYKRDNISVSAFSYTDKETLENESKRLNLNEYFIDDHTLFNEFKAH